MTTISERLRAVDHMSVEDCFLQSPLYGRAADTIDALVAALQNFTGKDEYCREDYEEADAALALARKGV